MFCDVCPDNGTKKCPALDKNQFCIYYQESFDVRQPEFENWLDTHHLGICCVCDKPTEDCECVPGEHTHLKKIFEKINAVEKAVKGGPVNPQWDEGALIMIKTFREILLEVFSDESPA